MPRRPRRFLRLSGIAALAMTAVSGPASASSYLFWMPPTFAGAPVTGDEPGLTLPLPGAKPDEVRANLLWTLRSGLNVAALQCQFAPALATVRNYNVLIGQHAVELNTAYQSLSGYFKRTAGKTWSTALDQYTTRVYNGFSTLNAQLGFCDAAGQIGRDALARPRGSLYVTAQERMRELRNSLLPVGDGIYAQRYQPVRPLLPTLAPDCWDKNDQMKKKCWATPLS